MSAPRDPPEVSLAISISPRAEKKKTIPKMIFVIENRCSKVLKKEMPSITKRRGKRKYPMPKSEEKNSNTFCPTSPALLIEARIKRKATRKKTIERMLCIVSSFTTFLCTPCDPLFSRGLRLSLSRGRLVSSILFFAMFKFKIC